MSRSHRQCLIPSLAICLLSAASAQAQTPAPERTVAAQGVASVKVVAPIKAEIGRGRARCG